MRSAPCEHPAKLDRITAAAGNLNALLRFPVNTLARASLRVPWIAGRDAAINPAASLQANKARTR